MKIIRFVGIVVILGLFPYSCAKKGTPTGGAKDSIPPVLVNASPKQNTLFFDKNEITLTFDEYIKLEDLSKQLIISPPLESDKYDVEPKTTISKKIVIELLDSLAPETTYTFNFGESVVDNNEGNVLPFFSYTLSTGSTIDSLTLRGKVLDAFDAETDPYISLQLYPVDSAYTDSTVYKQAPLYVSSTLDSTLYRFQNLKAGTYEIIALRDAASNYFFDQNTDKIGFYDRYITLPQDSLIDLKIFKEITNFSWVRPYFVNDHHIGLPYYGEYSNQEMKMISEVPETFESLITKNPETDTLNYWFKGAALDSLKFEYALADSLRTTTVKFNKPVADSLVVTAITGRSLNLRDTFQLKSNLPIVAVNPQKIAIENIDSTAVPFTTSINSNYDKVALIFDIAPSDKYQIKLLPEALVDFFDNTHDTLSFETSTKKIEDYGTIIIQLEYLDNTPYILEVVNRDKVVRKVSDTNGQQRFTFDLLPPGNYTLRFIVDANGNQQWDTGNYLKKVQAEEVLYFPTPIELRANWDINEVINVAQIRRDLQETATASATLEANPNSTSQEEL